jgi:hypothetical protein
VKEPLDNRGCGGDTLFVAFTWRTPVERVLSATVSLDGLIAGEMKDVGLLLMVNRDRRGLVVKVSRPWEARPTR